MAEPTYTNAQFALLMALKIKEIQPSADTLTAAERYFNFLHKKEPTNAGA